MIVSEKRMCKPPEDKFVIRIQTITSRGPTLPYFQSMMSFWDHSRLDIFRDVWFIPPSGEQCSDIPIGRNLCIEHDLELPWHAWLWIDDDHEFDAQVVHSLIDAMRRGAVDVVSPLIGSKSLNEPGRPMVFESYDAALGLWNIMYSGWEKPDLYEIGAVGTGFQLVKREVFEKMEKPWYERTANRRNRQKLHGNDLNFCLKAKEAGFRVWLDSRAEVGHANMTVFYPRRDYLESGLQKQGLNERRLKNPITASKKEDVNTPAFWDEYYQSQGWKWREQRHEVLAELVDRIPDGATMLHFGCGDGWFAQQVRNRGENVSVFGLDHSAAAISLCRNRGIECALIPSMVDFKYMPGARKFDYIVITDWLERLPDPEFSLYDLLLTYGHKDTQIISITPAATLSPEDVPEHHHIFGEFNLGHFFQNFGRSLEIKEFTENLRATDGTVIHQIPRYVTRSTLEKMEMPDGVASLV